MTSINNNSAITVKLSISILACQLVTCALCIKLLRTFTSLYYNAGEFILV